MIIFRRTATDPLIIGHRGDMSQAPENTLVAIDAAVKNGVEMVEVDARRTSDGHIVLSHDRTVDRCTNGHGAISQMTFQQIRGLDTSGKFSARFAGEKIPTLSEVLDRCSGRTALNIHINNYNNEYPGLEDEVVREVRSHHAEAWTLLSCFDRPAIDKIKADNPDLQTGLLVDNEDLMRTVKIGTAAGAGLGLGVCLAAALSAPLVIGGLLAGAALGFAASLTRGRTRELDAAITTPADVLLPNWSVVDKRWVRKAHAAGKPVIPYATANPRIERRMVQNDGCDGIFANNPERFVPRVRARVGDPAQS